MGLDPGTMPGRYEIRSKIGAGGMGEVYLAHSMVLDPRFDNLRRGSSPAELLWREDSNY